MQKKTTLVITGVIAIAICGFLFIRSKYLVKPEKKEVIAFLEQFNTDVNTGNTDNLLKYFDTRQKTKQLSRLLNLLSSKTGSDGKAPLFYVSLAPDQSQVKIINSEILQASVPVLFNEKVNNGNNKQTFILLKLRKVSNGIFKIIKIDARTFYSDFVAYENNLRMNEPMTDADYDPITLASFKVADQLKSRYDTVTWFQHIDQKTYYYVVKGEWKTFYSSEYDNDRAKDDHKMGLVNPDLKEIIPVEYDLVHNVGGTINGMVEVEKDAKRGLYNVHGRLVVPVNYDQILPITDNENLAVLRTGDDYYYLKKDSTITDKIANFDIAATLKKIKGYGQSYDLAKISKNDVMEYNSKEQHASIILPPSYLVDWHLQPHHLDLPNPMRNHAEYESMSSSYVINFEPYTAHGSWYEVIFNTIENDYVDARSGLYETRNVLLVDKKHNEVLGYAVSTDDSHDEEGGTLSGKCNELFFRSLNDSLFEMKTSTFVGLDMHNGKFLNEAPAYHYLYIKDNKLREYPGARVFNFTKYVKMDESYLNGCFVYDDKVMGYVSDEMLQYMKNEIFAEYNYNFKNPKWVSLFENRFKRYNTTLYDDVADSLTAIDKYNIGWINTKLKTSKINTSKAAE